VPPDRVFFTDRDLGRKIFPGVLREAGLRVEVHSDHFRPDAPDAQWLPAVSARGWIVLSNDQKILRRPLEREAVRSSGAVLLVLVGGGSPAQQLARNFLNTLPKIEEFLHRHAPPLIAKVYRPTPVDLIESGRPGRVELKEAW
jgi:hypothetical protein